MLLQDEDENHQIVLHIIQDLMKKGQESQEIFLEHFGRLGLFGRVQSIAGPIEEQEGAISMDEKVEIKVSISFFIFSYFFFTKQLYLYCTKSFAMNKSVKGNQFLHYFLFDDQFIVNYYKHISVICR